VGVNAAAYAALLALRGESTQAADYVFATRTGKALDRHAAHRLLKRVLQRAGVKECAGASCHWLRHSHATHSLQQGANVADVKAQLGHSSLNTTSLYVHAGSYSSDKLPL
jgi:integrase/recombinase XerD